MQALILAGGSGTRFWPVSRRRRPKQLVALEGERTLLQTTVDRLRALMDPAAIWVVTTEALAPEVHRQLPEVPPAQVLAEPEGRNTAPAMGWAVASMPEEIRSQVIGVFPADHRVAEPDAFRRTLGLAVDVATREDRVLTLGVLPRWPETGYGYLELGETLEPKTGLRRVVRFTEKPSLEEAQAFVASGNYLWNAGIFVFRGTTLLALLRRFQPEIFQGLQEISAHPDRTGDIYSRLPSISIDYAVMEKMEGLATLPLDCGWSDLGSWAALAKVLPVDGGENAVRGEVLALDASDNLLYAQEGTIAVLGVKGLAVVQTGDAVLVMPKARAQEVRRIVEALEAQGREELL